MQKFTFFALIVMVMASLVNVLCLLKEKNSFSVFLLPVLPSDIHCHKKGFLVLVVDCLTPIMMLTNSKTSHSDHFKGSHCQAVIMTFVVSSTHQCQIEIFQSNRRTLKSAIISCILQFLAGIHDSAWVPLL